MGRFPNNRWNLSISAFWLVVMIVAVLATSNVSLGQSLNVQLQQQVDEALDRDLDGIIVYIDVAGSPSSVYSAGIQNRATAAPMDPNALFKIASISKLYIAAAAAILVDRDSLSLDDKLTDFFPELRSRIENADEITIRMLLKHRSGIPDFIREKDFPWADPSIPLDDYLALVLDQKAHFKPDTRKKYSNTNYLLIGNIMDQVLGFSHHQLIQSEILDPLELTRTYHTLDDIHIDDLICGYDSHYEDELRSWDYRAPGGSMIATAGDVAVFLRGLVTGAFFNERQRQIYSEIYDYNHTGLLPGYQSIAKYHESIDAVVIQFTNTSGGTARSRSNSVYKGLIRTLKETYR